MIMQALALHLFPDRRARATRSYGFVLRHLRSAPMAARLIALEW